MPKLRRLSGSAVIQILAKFGFQKLSQRGSHVKLRRVLKSGEKQTLTVPKHKSLDTGMLKALIKQASRYIDFEYIEPHFYE
ncbi:MAG: type II toxin-antitoxin system HicA family toxin [Planctomycetes bacterium]|nr:type II toxin-antitoxin system HicA family toxin [Planctomycetota bacterium]